MGSSFDIVAKDYDQNFTYSNIGVLQRKQVYKYLEKYILNTKKQTVLEINCGTGEDAFWFAEKGHKVLATDASKEMISVARNKAEFQNVIFQHLQIQKLNQLENEEFYDLIFSNFGGLNCLSKQEFSLFLNHSKKLLKEDGNLIMVIMSKNCVWDNLYLLFKAKWQHLGRRNTINSIPVNVNGHKVNTWYYNPNDILNLRNETLNLVDYRPVGFFIPPSYLESYFKNKSLLLKFLGWLDKCVSRFSFLARFSDHYLIHLKV